MARLRIVVFSFAFAIVAAGHGQSQRNPVPNPSVIPRPTISVSSLVVPQKAREHLSKAMAAYARRDLAEAWSRVNISLELAPEFADALSFRGFLELNVNRSDASMDDLQHALRADPGIAETYLHMGSLLNHLARYDEALHYLARHDQLAPNSWAGAFEMAKSHLGRHEYAKALEQAHRASLLGGEARMASALHMLRGDALFNLKQYEQALPELEMYLTAEPNGNLANVARELMTRMRAPHNVEGVVAEK